MDNERYIKLSKIAGFRPNSRSYALTLISVIFELAYTVMILDVINTNKKIFGVVMVNIIMLFGLFYVAVREKNYSLKAGVICLFVAAYILLRTFTIVPLYLAPSSRGGWITAMNVFSSILLVASAVNDIDMSRRMEKYSKEEVCNASSKA